MIYVDVERCTGCENCLDICPTDAISMRNGTAFIEESLCAACEVCLDVCPQNAILAVEVLEPVASKQIEAVPTLQVEPPSTNLSLRGALPVVGSALLRTGREILPRLASLAIDMLDSQPDAQIAPAQKDNQQYCRGQGRGQGRGRGRGQGQGQGRGRGWGRGRGRGQGRGK